MTAFGPRYLYCGIDSVPAVIPSAAGSRLGIEVVFDDTSDIWPQTRWENLLQTADAIRDAGLEAAVHGPFHGVNLGSRDPGMRRISGDMLLGALEFARAVSSPHMVMHTGFLPQYAPNGRLKWIEQFCANMQPLIDRAMELEVRIVLENTYEHDPSLFEEIFERLQNPALGMCLDTGHATCFGRVDPVEWPLRFADQISHIHCSDNDGRDDLHWGLGRGVVKFAELLRPLKAIGAFATVTFEVIPDDAAGARRYFDDLVKTL